MPPTMLPTTITIPFEICRRKTIAKHIFLYDCPLPTLTFLIFFPLLLQVPNEMSGEKKSAIYLKYSVKIAYEENHAKILTSRMQKVRK